LSWIVKKSYPLFSQVQGRLDALNTVMQENLAGVRVVKAFVRSDYEMGRFREANDSLMRQNIKAVRMVSVTMPLMTLLLNIGVVGAIWIGVAPVPTESTPAAVGPIRTGLTAVAQRPFGLSLRTKPCRS
jgi:ATP-binding cassette subfamily B protein